MNKLLFFFAISLLCSCTPEVPKEYPACEASSKYGDTEICLPQLEDLVDGYGNPQVKALADQLEYPGNTVLAYYVADSVIEKLSNFESVEMENYFKIYVVDKGKEVKASKEELETVSRQIKGSFIEENWDEIMDNMDEQMSALDMSMGQPFLIEEYAINDESKSYVLLTEFSTMGEQNKMLCVINLMLLKERFVFMAYYKEYVDKATIVRIKQKNDVVLKSIMSSNAAS